MGRLALREQWGRVCSLVRVAWYGNEPPAGESQSLRSGYRSIEIVLVGVILLTAVTAYGLARGIWELDLSVAHDTALSARCQNKLKQLGLVYKIFANESAGELWPQLSAENGRLMFDPELVHPEYLPNEEVLICPGPVRELPGNLFDDLFYVYTGYVLTSDEDVLAFAEGYVAANGDFSSDLVVGETTIRRLREGIERFFITDINNPAAAAIAQSEIPVMWDWPDNHQQGWGGNVLYMDGHVEWQAYPGEFPMTEVAFTTLANLAGYTPPDAWTETSRLTPPDPHISRCFNNFNKLALMHKMFANESQVAHWPALSTEPGRLMFEAVDVYPEYVQARDFLTCPGRADAPPLPIFGDDHYIYWGYLLAEEADFVAFADAYGPHLASGGDFEDNLDVTVSYGDTLFRLREGIERFLITDINNPASAGIAQSKTPVMMEWPWNHEGTPGGTVLYMDGHREWHDYPGEFPMTEAVVEALRSIAQLAMPDPYREPDTFYRAENDPYDFLLNCLDNISSLRLTSRMYANEHSGNMHPPLSSEAGKLAPDEEEIFGDYLTDTELFVCPGPVFEPVETLINDQHYLYTGYVLLSDSDVQQFAAAYADVIASGGDFTADIPLASSYGDTLLRLGEDVGQELTWPPGTPLEEIPTEYDIPVYIEWPGNHEGQSGGHVIYLDGRTEWLAYPGEFPMTETTISTLAALAGWTPATAWESRPFWDEFDPYDQALCQRNLKTFGYGFKTFANHAAGNIFPMLNAEEGLLIFDDDTFVQHHIFDLRRLNCPGSPQAYRQPVADDHSYVYLGYVAADQEALERFSAAYAQQIAAGGDFGEDLVVGEEPVVRIREGTARFLITDINNPAAAAIPQRSIPILIEWPDNHGGIRGGNVLYMDGHVEWLDYPGEYPMTEEAMAILTELAGRGPIRAAAAPREQSRLDALLSAVGGSSRR